MTYYPQNDFGPLIKGMVIGGMGIFHVFLAQFAIGGGMMLCFFELRSQRRGDASARHFVDGYFKTLVLVSFVLGALTGVAMWFTTIQISPGTIGTMVHEFHWIWATEWTFFCLEIVAGYLFYRYGGVLSDRSRLTLLVLYSIAAWMSLFWINGILSWQLTPGQWSETRRMWSGFFNPSFWPSLAYRTVSALTIASLAACLVINLVKDFAPETRKRLIHQAALGLAPMVLMPALGAWYLAVIPPDSRSWVLGGSPAMTMFMGLAVAASLVIGIYAIVGIIGKRLYFNVTTASLLCVLAFGATAGGEFVREGVRKPFTIREYLYSNSIPRTEVAELRRIGCTTRDPYPLRDARTYPNDQVRLGARVFRVQCSVCHTYDGVNGLAHLAGTWSQEQRRMNIAQLQQTKPFMPPFAGTAREVEAVGQLIGWLAAGRPQWWEESSDPAALKRIAEWLDAAGPHPNTIQDQAEQEERLIERREKQED